MLFYLGVEALRKSFEVAVEEKQGISRLEQVVEEISEAERAKELRREQKRLKKKARRKEKCKCGTHLTISTANNELQTEETAKNEEELEEEEVCTNEIVEETRDMNGHGDSCEDDEDDGDSGGSPCSCEDLSNSERSKSKKSGFRNGDYGYVAEYNKWSRMVHQSGDMCNHDEDSSTLGGEEEDICTDCLSGSPISGGSPQSNNGKGRKKKGKNKEKKQNSPRHDMKLMGWKDGGTESMECFSSEEDLCISEQEIQSEPIVSVTAATEASRETSPTI